MLGGYRLSVDAILGRMLAELVRLLLVGYDPADRNGSVDRLTPHVAELVRAARAEVYDEAVTLLQGLAADAGVDEPYIPSRGGYGDQSARSVLREELRGSPDEAAERVGRRLSQHAEDAGRQTMVRAVEDGREPESPADREHMSHDALPEIPAEKRGSRRAKSWARVLTGAENCAFCVVLASRGPVYSSAANAGRMTANEKFDETGLRGYVNSYHDNCDCLVVPVYDFASWPGREDYLALERLYKQATSNPIWNGERVGEDVPRRDWPGSAKNDLLAAVDRELRYMQKQGIPLPVSDVRTGEPVKAAA